MTLFALLALLTQCLLPVGHAFAMSKASQDAAFAQSICSYHAESRTSGNEADPADLSGKLPPCPMCQAGGLGNVLALPSQPPSDIRLRPEGQPAKLRWIMATQLAAALVFDQASPRGPPAII